MNVFKQSELAPDAIKSEGSVVSIGNFDGVHRGHQQILERLDAAKQRFKVPSIVYTFEPHPVRLLNPKKDLKLIFCCEERYKLLSRYNPDMTIVAEFTRELAATPAEEFVKQILVDQLRAKMVVVGYDFNFGSGGDGNAEGLARLGKRFGFEVEQVPAVMLEGRPISSSRLRRLIAAGEIAMVNRMLGRPFFLSGTVVHGHSRGSNVLGIPTANLSTQQEVIPAKGIYAALVRIPSGIYGGAVNVGVNPTFDNGTLSIEAHIIDFSDKLYESEMEIHFIRRLRDEKKFDSIDRLREQMQEDIEKARVITTQIAPEIINR